MSVGVAGDCVEAVQVFRCESRKADPVFRQSADADGERPSARACPGDVIDVEERAVCRPIGAPTFVGSKSGDFIVRHRDGQVRHEARIIMRR